VLITVGYARQAKSGVLAEIATLLSSYPGVLAVPAVLATSGTSERGSHILDPHTEMATAEILSASVIGPDLALADALATGVAAGGLRALRRVADLDGYAALCLDRHGRWSATPRLNCEGRGWLRGLSGSSQVALSSAIDDHATHFDQREPRTWRKPTPVTTSAPAMSSPEGSAQPAWSASD